MPPCVIVSLESLMKLAGTEFGVSEWLVVTQDRIDAFAATTEDRQWIHIDPERSQRESPYRTTIAHGFLTLSLISHFMKQAVEVRGIRMAINYGLNRVRFPRPVLCGARIRGRFTLQAATEISGTVEATYVVTVESEPSADSPTVAKPCCVAEWIVRYYT
ncbi:MAG: MaoC family dehydratase [Candidatus Acidiferrales bacterium]